AQIMRSLYPRGVGAARKLLGRFASPGGGAHSPAASTGEARTPRPARNSTRHLQHKHRGPGNDPGPRHCEDIRYRLEAEADTGREDVGVMRVAVARRGLRQRVVRLAHEHVAGSVVPGHAGAEPPRDIAEDLGADVVAVTVRALATVAVEDRDQARSASA